MSGVRPVPDDFATFAMVETTRELAQRYRVGGACLRGWIAASGIVRPELKSQRIAIPADFAEQQLTRSIRELAKLYGVSRSTIDKWLISTGVRRRTAPGEFPVVAKAASKPKPKSKPFFRQQHKCSVIDAREVSPAGEAARYLSKLCPVYRCNELGRPSQGGEFWRRGNAVLTDAELIERADELRSRERRAA